MYRFVLAFLSALCAARGKTLLLAGLALFTGVMGTAAPIPITAPTNLWNVVSLGSLNQMDYIVDLQTGQPESDIVGAPGHPGFYWHFDNNGAASSTDGTLSFRVRLGQDTNPAGFDNYLYVGILADAGDTIDMFVGVQGSGSTAQKGIKIWAPGAGLNISPSTTTISSPADQVRYAFTSSNYDWSPVNTTGLDPTLTNSDLDGGGKTDYFLSFSIPFSAVVIEAQRLAGLMITDQTALRFVLATATNQNSFNQDIGGLNGGLSSTQTYTQLGAISVALTPSAPPPPPPPPPPAPVPEPAAMLLTGSGLVAAALLAKRSLAK